MDSIRCVFPSSVVTVTPAETIFNAASSANTHDRVNPIVFRIGFAEIAGLVSSSASPSVTHAMQKYTKKLNAGERTNAFSAYSVPGRSRMWSSAAWRSSSFCFFFAR